MKVDHWRLSAFLMIFLVVQMKVLMTVADDATRGSVP
jgi:hypothetical protein